MLVSDISLCLIVQHLFLSLRVYFLESLFPCEFLSLRVSVLIMKTFTNFGSLILGQQSVLRREKKKKNTSSGVSAHGQRVQFHFLR